MTEDKASTDFEVLLRKIAIDLTGGIFFERMAPNVVWERVEKPVAVLLESAVALREEAVSLKPERFHTINHHYEAMVQRLNTFRAVDKLSLGARTTPSSPRGGIRFSPYSKRSQGKPQPNHKSHTRSQDETEGCSRINSRRALSFPIVWAVRERRGQFKEKSLLESQVRNSYAR